MTISAPVTGASSTSAKFASGGAASGIGLVLVALVQNKHGITTDVQTIVGGVTTVVSVLAKLYHDIKLHGFHYAALAQAAQQVETVVKADIPVARDAAAVVEGTVKA